MAVRPVLTYPDPMLREKCAPVAEIDEAIRGLAADMADTLHDAPGLGLAAPQVGEAVRLVVVDLTAGREEDRVQYFINPEVESAEGEAFEEEGCLSLPEVKEKVRRPERVRVRALNLEGREILVDARGLLARVLQHEIDHLDGVLLFDHLNRLKGELIKRRMRKRKKAEAARQPA